MLKVVNKDALKVVCAEFLKKECAEWEQMARIWSDEKRGRTSEMVDVVLEEGTSQFALFDVPAVLENGGD
jgi:hypothetical protein